MALTSIDIPPIYEVEFKAEFENWLTILVDQLNTNIELMPAAISANLGGNGVTPQDVLIEGMDDTAVVVATMRESTNGVGVLSAISATGKFTVTFTGDPGADAYINYMVRL